MISLSLCMIVKNEHDTLSRCLECIKDIVDEIIIIDTGSTDDTKDIAFKYTDKVYDFKWCDDFAKARNFSFSKATKEYIMWLDADDIILEKDREKLKILKKILTPDIDMVYLKYNLNLDENGIPALSFYRERILKRSKNYKWISPIHEVIEQNGKTLYEDISITHSKIHVSDPNRNIRIFENMLKQGITLDPRQTFYYARELMYLKRYNESIKTYLSVLENPNSWNQNKISACIDLSNIYLTLNKQEKALDYLFKSFKYDIPQAESCCLIGNYFISKQNFPLAIYWFETALNSKLNMQSGGFYIKDYYDFIPYINLGFCYYNLNDISKAYEYNELAGKIKPNNETYLKNKTIYEELKTNS